MTAPVPVPRMPTVLPASITRSIDTLVQDGQPVTVRYAITGTLARENSMALYMRVLDDLLELKRHFVLDFAAAAYVDGRALQVLKQLSQRVLEIRGGVLAFENVNEDLYTLLELTRFTNLFVVRKAASAEVPGARRGER